MNYLGPLGRVFGGLKGLYSGINGATLTGAIDVIIVEQEDGTFKCTPFHVRFGKLGVLRSREKVVDIEVNGIPAPIRMKLGESGEAFFVQEFDSDDEFEDENLITSPLPSSSPQHSDHSSDLMRNGIIGLPSPVVGGMTDDSVPISNDKRDDDSKKKRKRRKRRNHGSKSDIILNQSSSTTKLDQLASTEPMFKMDEDYLSTGVSDAFKNLELANHHNHHLTQSRSFHRDFYSDTEIDATSTPQNSRPSTPIQSDSEYEISKIQKGDDVEVGKWVWGELPSTTVTTPVANTQLQPFSQNQNNISGSSSSDKSKSDRVPSDEEIRQRSGSESKSSMLAGMFSFMKRNNSQAGADDIPGIYLDNLETMGPEQAALYFPNYGREMREYNRRSNEQDEDVESGKGSSLPQSPQPGSSPKSTSHLSSYMEERNERQRINSGPSEFEAISLCGSSFGLFEQSKLTYDELVENPELILNAPPESIVVKVDGKLIPWPAALPQLLSTTFFKRPLPPHITQKLLDQYIKKDSPNTSISTPTNPPTDSVSIKESRKSFWFPWRRSQNSTITELSDESQQQQQEISPAIKSSTSSSSDESEIIRQEILNQKLRLANRRDMTVINISNIQQEKYKKSLRLTSDQIKQLSLKYGQNEGVFSVTTAYQGTSIARCHIYLWRYDDRIVISDIDGTITKSDVLGHVLPMIGTDWAQSGVAQLFTQIQDNGYKLLYLSARAIGQAQTTREYLRSIRQGDVTLPDGPLLLNPTSLMSAFHREVIERKPEEFKIACLKDVQLLFPSNPFYAGYGNRINDVWAYRAVDVPIPRIFTINHKGELRHALTNTFQSSYTSLVELAEHIFPPYKNQRSYSLGHADGYSNFEFWREPIQIVSSIGPIVSDQLSTSPPVAMAAAATAVPVVAAGMKP